MIVPYVLLESGEDGGEKVAKVTAVILLLVHHFYVVVGLGAKNGKFLYKEKNALNFCTGGR